MVVVKGKIQNLSAPRMINLSLYHNPIGANLTGYRTKLDPVVVASKLNPGFAPERIRIARADDKITIARWQEGYGTLPEEVKIWHKINPVANAPDPILIVDVPPAIDEDENGGDEDAEDDEHKTDVTGLYPNTSTIDSNLQTFNAAGGPSTLLYHGGNHHFAIGSDGTLHVTADMRIAGGYSRNKHYYSTDGGETWSSEWIDTNTTVYTIGTCIAIDKDDNLHFCWFRYGGSVYYRKKTAAGTWDASVTDVAGSGANAQWDPDIRVDQDGNVHIVWSGSGWGTNPGYDNVQYRKKTSTGWQAREAITDRAAHNWYCSLDLDETDYPHLIWGATYYHGVGLGAVCYRYKNSSGWQSTEDATSDYTTEDNGWNDNLMITADGVKHIIYVAYDGGTPDNSPQYVYRKRTDSGWQSAEWLTDNTAGKRDGQLSVDKNNNIHCIYGYDYPNNTDPEEIFYIYKTDTGWQTETKLTTNTWECTSPHLLFSMWPKIGQYINLFQQGWCFAYVRCTDAYSADSHANIIYEPKDIAVVGSIEPEEEITIESYRTKQRGVLCHTKINPTKIAPCKIG